ncbi:MAG TPA: methyltransferase domain-containing protein, partial [Jatrophihabitans sp.]|nr:methyltransferase domain-containing protein [Jatrophihabitans sp.]
IGDFYDQMGGLIEIMGGNIHVGYWTSDEDRTPLLEAINRLTDIVGSKLDLQPGQHLLDVGCGVGVPAIRLGQRVEARITGVTNSPWQVQEATRRIRAAGLRGQVTVEHGDAAALSFADATFDAVLAFQSLQHASDRDQWLREMVRVLRPGGRIVLTEFISEIALTDAETEILLAGAMQPPTRDGAVLEAVRNSGVVIDEVTDCGDRIRRSYPAYFDRLDRHRAELIEAFGEERIQAQQEAMGILLPIYRDKIGYLIVTGHKPA